MTAKMKSKPHRKDSREDWDIIRVPVMKWCLRIKLAQNWDKFSALLDSTGDMPIVEHSRKDPYWGAKMTDDGVLEGENVLGRLLMELRAKMRAGRDQFEIIHPIPVRDFLLLGSEIREVFAEYCGAQKESERLHADLFSNPRAPF